MDGLDFNLSHRQSEGNAHQAELEDYFKGQENLNLSIRSKDTQFCGSEHGELHSEKRCPRASHQRSHQVSFDKRDDCMSIRGAELEGGAELAHNLESFLRDP